MQTVTLTVQELLLVRSPRHRTHKRGSIQAIQHRPGRKAEDHKVIHTAARKQRAIWTVESRTAIVIAAYTKSLQAGSDYRVPQSDGPLVSNSQLAAVRTPIYTEDLF